MSGLGAFARGFTESFASAPRRRPLSVLPQEDTPAASAGPELASPSVIVTQGGPGKTVSRRGGTARSAGALTTDTREAYDWFVSNGYSPAAAAGIVGNLVQESGPNLNASAVHDNGTGLGIAGWRDPDRSGGRKSALISYAKANGLNPLDRETQYRFLDHELRTSESGVGGRLRAAQTPDEAASVFIGYERPQGWSANNPSGGHGFDNRVGNARRIYTTYYVPEGA